MQEWGKNLIRLEKEEAITPYMHIFIYYVEFFLKVVIFIIYKNRNTNLWKDLQIIL